MRHERLSRFERTISGFLKMNRKLRRVVGVYVDGRFQRALGSLHRTRGGLKYNALIRLRRRLSGDWT